jgi:dTDP-4-dehydrorhamnose reductase
MKKIILTGSSGYIGKYLKSRLSKSCDVITRSWRGATVAYGNLCHDIETIHPDLVINSAGFVGKPNVDMCENHKAECWMANVEFPVALCLACKEHGVPFGHVSSGCVYSDGPHDEDDAPNFTGSWYSYTKASAERRLNEISYDKLWLWRLRMPFDNDFNTVPPRNLLAKLIGYSSIIEGLNSITYIPDFVSAIEKFALSSDNLPYGTWNLVNPEPILNSRIIELMDYERPIIDKDSRTAKLLMAAPRSFCTLSTNKAQAFGLSFMHTEAAILEASKDL